MEGLFPEVGGSVGAACGIGGIACAAAVSLVEGEEVGCVSGEAGGHPDGFGVEGEVGEGATFEFKDGFAGISIAAILCFCIFGSLSGEGIFEFEGNEGNSVETQSKVDDAIFCVRGIFAGAVGGFRFFGGLAVLELAGEGELVGLVVGFEFGVQVVGGFESGDVEVASVAFEAMTEYLQATVRI